MPDRQPVLAPRVIINVIGAIFAGSDLHRKQVEAISHAVLGAMHAPQAGVAKIGTSMAVAREKKPKHAIKQFDRLLSNTKIDDESAIAAHIGFVVGGRRRVVASLDWTEHAREGHHRIALNLVTKHGRATPLCWKTVTAEELTGRRNEHEDELLRLFKRLLPPMVKQVIILADRAFGDIGLYSLLKSELGFDFSIRFRDCIMVRDAHGTAQRGAQWVPPGGRARRIRHAKVTGRQYPIEAVVAVRKPRMKENWLIATSLDWSAEEIVKLYGRRFTCEENFRDEKDPRFGLGTLNVRIGKTTRRDRMTLILALATALLTLLGAVGEKLKLDRGLRANTAKRRTHSLFRQGREYLRGAIGAAKTMISRLREAFIHAVRNQAHVRALYAEI
jgi:Transposase DDE domain